MKKIEGPRDLAALASLAVALEMYRNTLDAQIDGFRNQAMYLTDVANLPENPEQYSDFVKLHNKCAETLQAHTVALVEFSGYVTEMFISEVEQKEAKHGASVENPEPPVKEEME